MNIEAYDADSLRKLVRLLEYENRILKDKLKKENIPYDEVNLFEETIDNVEEYDPDQGERIVNPPFISEEMAAIFRNVITDGMCRFIVFDFDNHEKGAEATDFANTDNEWHKEVDALRKMCEINGIKPLVERSRSGKGAHVTVITIDPEEVVYGSADVCYYLISEMKQVGINVVTKAEVEERFAVIDDELVWHGGMNLLGKVDIWDNLMRIKNHQVAAELLEISLGITTESEGG